MSFSPRPCSHCGGTSFHVVPGVQLELRGSAAVLGVAKATLISRERWSFTIVMCTQCGRSETFTTEPAKLAAYFPTAQIVTTNRPG
jgi:predicted nucleic-acid-binding Zn-ribbon protein